MTKTLIFFVLSLILSNVTQGDAANWASIENYNLKYPFYISGTYVKGSNLVEPAPVRGKYLEVDVGGVVIIKKGAGFFLKIHIIKTPNSLLYFKIEYPNPLDASQPFINGMEYNPDGNVYIFSSPSVIKGLAGYGDYVIKIYVYDNKEAKNPIEILEQTVRSYVDTRENEILIFTKVLSTVN